MNRTPVMNDEARKEYAGAPVLDVGAGQAPAKSAAAPKAPAAPKKKPAAKAKAKK